MVGEAPTPAEFATPEDRARCRRRPASTFHGSSERSCCRCCKRCRRSAEDLSKGLHRLSRRACAHAVCRGVRRGELLRAPGRQRPSRGARSGCATACHAYWREPEQLAETLRQQSSAELALVSVHRPVRSRTGRACRRRTALSPDHVQPARRWWMAATNYLLARCGVVEPDQPGGVCVTRRTGRFASRAGDWFGRASSRR